MRNIDPDPFIGLLVGIVIAVTMTIGLLGFVSQIPVPAAPPRLPPLEPEPEEPDFSVLVSPAWAERYWIEEERAKAKVVTAEEAPPPAEPEPVPVYSAGLDSYDRYLLSEGLSQPPWRVGIWSPYPYRWH